MATVTLADDGISSVLSLASSATPRGGVMLMIVTLRRIVYRLRHQSDILGEGGRGWGGKIFKKLFGDLSFKNDAPTLVFFL